MTKRAKTKAAGVQIAKQILARRKAVRAKRDTALAKLRKATGALGARAEGLADPAAPGHLIAAGDSWFDYPGAFLLQHDDILTMLEEQGYTVETTAHAGDPIEAMAYGQSGQLYRLARCFERLKDQGQTPVAVLLSGGGDDIAGDEFGMLLNSAESPIAGWSDAIVANVINTRIKTAYLAMVDQIKVLSQGYFKTTLPILIHGYDYAVPDGRGFGGVSLFAGPWLKPGFDEKFFLTVKDNVPMVKALIDKFNEMLTGLPAARNFVHYVDLRGTLSNSPANYTDWWANELHPTKKGFTAVTAKFVKVLGALPPAP